MVMMLNQAPVNTAAVSYTAIWALRNVEAARPKNSCESFYLSIPPPPPLSNVGRHSPSRPRRGIDPTFGIRRRERAQMK